MRALFDLSSAHICAGSRRDSHDCHVCFFVIPSAQRGISAVRFLASSGL